MTDAGPDPARAQSITVLHVDDDPASVDLVRRFLERETDDASVTVRSTTDPTDVLDVLDRAAIDCVVSDFDMGAMDGLALLHSVRDASRDLPFILFTGSEREDIRRRVSDAGPTACVRKGDSEQLRILARLVRTSVRRHRREQAAGPVVAGPSRRLERAPAAQTDQRSAESRRDAGQASRALMSSIDDAWRDGSAPETGANDAPESQVCVDERGLRRLLEWLAAESGPGGQSSAASTHPQPDGFYLENRQDVEARPQRRPTIEHCEGATGTSTAVGLEEVREIARDYGWQTHTTSAVDGRLRIEFTRRNRPVPQPR